MAHRGLVCLLSELAGISRYGRAEANTHNIMTIDIEYILNIYDNDARDIAAWFPRRRDSHRVNLFTLKPFKGISP